jgi:prepilin peptidase CpaA
MPVTDALVPAHAVLLIVSIIATITDFWRQKIYNWLTLPTLVLGLALNAWARGWSGLLDSASGLLLGGLIFLVLGLMGAMKGGDVKLAAAVGALIGWQLTISALYYGALIGGVLAVIWALIHGTLFATLRRVGRALIAVVTPGMRPEVELQKSETAPMPYGPAISWGAVVAVFALPPVV